jgi:hypothetical protein
MVSSVANGIFGQQNQKEPEKKPSSLSKYKMSPNFQGTFPTPNVYQPRYAAEGGIMDSYAAGGVANQGYPGAQIDSTQYATPSQMPTSAQVVNADYEQATDPYLGSPLKMAEGGIAGYAIGGMPNGGMNFGGNGTNAGIFGLNSFLGAEPAPPPAPVTRLDPSFGVKPVTPNVYKPAYANTNAVPAPTQTIDSGNGILGEGASLLNAVSPQMPMSANSQYQPAVDPTPATPRPLTATQAAAAIMDRAKTPYVPGFSGGGIPGPGIDTGVISEDDPDFAFTSPYETTAGRLKKLYGKTHYGQKPPEAMPGLGKVNLTPANMKSAAQGGIMGYSLGGYAAGGNPRLLKGPGDGMSDNIPATIGDRQPARLADGEFVIPADVVSHLGNGSTDAGAKKLHGMMDTVRKARTGRKAQGKQINADKFIPK